MGRDFPLVQASVAPQATTYLPPCVGALEHLQEELLAKQRSTEWQEQELKACRDDRLAQVEEAV